MHPPSFSVATPTRNALTQLRRCVGSVRGQIGVSVEHLIQDAVSTDGTNEWLATQSQLDVRSEPDGGMYDAINRAWRRASGDILAWLNADEQYLQGTLEYVAQYFYENPGIDVAFADYLVTDPQGNAVAIRKEIPFRRIYVVNGFLYASSCTLFYRRSLLDRGLLTLDSRFRYAADKDLILRLDRAGVRIGHIDRCLSVFGIDGNNLSTHRQALVESELVRVEHGALRAPWARVFASGGRRVERLLRGAYWPPHFHYRYAVDEKPTYVDKLAATGGRYSLSS